MDIFIKFCTLFLFLMVFSKGELTGGILIQPEINDDVENSSVSFRCMLHSTNVSIVSWIPKGLGYICIYNQTCGNVLSNSKNWRITCRCENIKQDTLSVELQIHNITEKDHNTNMTCEATLTSTFLRASALLLVKVPAKSVEVMPAVKMVHISENSSFEFTCTTSMSQGKRANPNTTVKEFSYANSTLLYMPNRTVYGWMIFCSVEETDEQSKIQSSTIKLNITYPPESRLMINGMSTECVYKVIENGTGILNCTVEGGNPQPMISWTECFETEQSTANYANESTEIYSEILRWKAKSYTDTNCTCFCTHMEQNQSLAINVEILYPPSLPTISFGNQIITNNISVLMNTLLSLNCTSDSEPAATYQWMFNNVYMLDEQPYVIQSYKSDHGIYTCLATTIMDPTDAEKQIVTMNSSFQLQVLYPPTIEMIKDPNILEGSTLNLTCPVIFGNPSDTQIEWTASDKGGEQWSSKFLLISNVSRQHDGEYKCTVNNTMFPTFGPEKSGRNSRSFHLNVEYKATIKSFYVDGYEQQTNVTVHERNTLIFRCQVGGKPVSTTSIHFQTGHKLETFQSNDVSYKIVYITCQQTGAYVCSGRNKHNAEQVSKQTLHVFIYCSPRTDPRYPVKERITVSLYTTASLNFTALAYPTPKNVLWQKHNGHVWIDVNTTNNTNTHQSDLNFSLTIYNMLEENFGMYRLILKNEIGTYEQMFYINAEENEYTEHSIVDSFIAVGAGTFAATVLLFSLAIIVFKCLRTKQTHACCLCCDSKKQEVSETSPNNYMTIKVSRREDKVSSSTYEQLEIREIK